MSQSLIRLSAAIALAVALSGTALAGQCPAANVLKTPQPIRDAPDVGVTRDILSAVELKGWRGLGDFLLRTRRLVVAPGGIVPTHQHDDRPSIVYVVSGEIWEHNTFCSVPIRHRAGDWTPEFGVGHAHWWENKTKKPVVLTSSDIVPVEMMNDPHM